MTKRRKLSINLKPVQWSPSFDYSKIFLLTICYDQGDKVSQYAVIAAVHIRCWHTIWNAWGISRWFSVIVRVVGPAVKYNRMVKYSLSIALRAIVYFTGCLCRPSVCELFHIYADRKWFRIQLSRLLSPTPSVDRLDSSLVSPRLIKRERPNGISGQQGFPFICYNQTVFMGFLELIVSSLAFTSKATPVRLWT